MKVVLILKCSNAQLKEYVKQKIKQNIHDVYIMRWHCCVVNLLYFRMKQILPSKWL